MGPSWKKLKSETVFYLPTTIPYFIFFFILFGAPITLMRVWKSSLFISPVSQKIRNLFLVIRQAILLWLQFVTFIFQPWVLIFGSIELQIKIYIRATGGKFLASRYNLRFSTSGACSRPTIFPILESQNPPISQFYVPQIRWSTGFEALIL